MVRWRVLLFCRLLYRERGDPLSPTIPTNDDTKNASALSVNVDGFLPAKPFGRFQVAQKKTSVSITIVFPGV